MVDHDDAFGGMTRWTLIQRAADPASSAAADEAWRELIDRYRAPIAAILLRRLRFSGAPDGDAVDEFFTWLYECSVLRRADRARGRFRCFMNGVIQNYVRQCARARGLAAAPAAWDEPTAADDTAAFERDDELAWARGALDRGLDRLGETHPADASLLTRYYGLAETAPSREMLARELCITPNALDQRHHRAKQRLREAMEREVDETVESRLETEDEIELFVRRLRELGLEIV